MAQKFTTAIPTMFTSTSTASTPGTTTRPPTEAPVRVPTEMFTLKEAVLPTSSVQETGDLDTISAPARPSSERAEARALRGRIVSSGRKPASRLGDRDRTDRRKLFGQKVVYF